MAHMQNYLCPVEEIQEKNICIEDISGFSIDFDDSNVDENSIAD